MLLLHSFFTFFNFQDSSLFKILLVSLIGVWGLRLAIYLFIRILKTGKDKRFDGIREDLKRFGSFWLLQAVSIFVILLPSIYVLASEKEMNLNWVSSIVFVLALLVILIEGVADNQKYVFKSNEKNKERWIDTGLWRYSRHPNYLGEIMMWVGTYIYCLPFLNGIAFFTIISPIYISILLIKVSGIPTLEKKYEERFKGDREYEEYVKRTGKLLPRVFKL